MNKAILPEIIEDKFSSWRPLRWYLILWLGLVYLWAISWPQPTRALALFTALMLAHGVGHWFSWSLVGTNRRRLLLYSAAQIGLIVLISMVTHNSLVTLSLYVALAGMTIVLLGQVRLALVTVIIYLVLTTASIMLIIPEYNNLTIMVMIVVPLTLFVGGGAALFLQQVNERARTRALLNELEAAHRQLAEYAGRVEDLTLAAERQRMARELHDTLAQGLAGLILQLEAASSHLSGGRPERTQMIMQQAMARARTTLAEARQVIDDLRQGQVNPPDLTAAIRAEVDRFTTATGIPCALDLALPDAWPETWFDPARRVVAEGLLNVARHARASQVWVTAVCLENRLEIQVRDNGVGFDPAAVEAQPGHYGLLGMRERVRLAGGTLEIISTPGQGTTLRLGLPLSLTADNQ
jgi:two-component system, NarL family, sensor histidine kinase YdfH